METRELARVWHPAQHCALWLGAWATGHAGWDHVLAALTALTGRQGVALVDAVVPEVVDLSGDPGAAGLLRLVRAVAGDRPRGLAEEPVVRLVLSGPGEAPALPADAPVAAEARAAGAALVLADAAPGWRHVLVPARARGGVAWRWHSIEGPLPEPAHLSPGEADLLLAEATREAAAAIAARCPGGAAAGADPALTVGRLGDHLDLAETPAALPRRAAGLIARADRVAAILAGARAAAGAAADPELSRLHRPVRLARMAAVDYAVRTWQDAAG